MWGLPMDQLEFILAILGMLTPVIIFSITMVLRLIRLETKFDCLLMWVIEIDPAESKDPIKYKHKRDELKKQIEKQVNGNACKIRES